MLLMKTFTKAIDWHPNRHLFGDGFRADEILSGGLRIYYDLP